MTNEELAARIKAGERELMPELWEQVRRFVARMAARRYIFSNGYGGVEIDDLIQSGYIALCEAVERFEPDGEYKFITYLGTCLKTAFSEAGGYRSRKQYRDPLHSCASLDAPIDGEDANSDTLLDLQADPTDPFEDADRRIWLEQLHAVLEQAMDDLPTEQGETLRRRFWDGQTLKEIGEDVGATPEVIRQREGKALRNIRGKKRRYGLDQFAEEQRQAYIDEQTPWYLHVGVERFNSTGTSEVEEITLRRERLGRQFEEIERDRAELERVRSQRQPVRVERYHSQRENQRENSL